jgi:hypothetical protein
MHENVFATRAIVLTMLLSLRLVEQHGMDSGSAVLLFTHYSRRDGKDSNADVDAKQSGLMSRLQNLKVNIEFIMLFYSQTGQKERLVRPRPSGA